MSDRVKVRFFRKKDNQNNKIEFSHSDYLKVRGWFITGTFGNSYLLNEDFDRSSILLLKKIISVSPEKIHELIMETLDKTLNKNTFIYTLALLSNDNFRAKKIFKTLFNSIIKNPKDLYRFMEYCKKERGFGKIIHDTIKCWFKSIDIYSLEKMFVEYRGSYGWTAKDIIKMIKPKPISKHEQLLYKWIVKDYIDEEYKHIFKYIYAYEQMRTNNTIEQEVINNIKTLKFKNSMIPGNVKRTENIISAWIINHVDSEIPFSSIPRYINLINKETITSLSNILMTPKIMNNISLISLLSIYSEIKEIANKSEEIDLLNKLESTLLYKIKKINNSNTVHLLDTNEGMFNGKINNATPAIISSVLIGMSKSVLDFGGNIISNRTPRNIIEAEKFIGKYYTPNYSKIFSNLKESDLLIVWTNNSSFDKQEFMRRFIGWKNENKIVVKVVFMNLYSVKKIPKHDFKEIYTINDKTEKLLEYIKYGEIL
jgi:hypothetical protein